MKNKHLARGLLAVVIASVVGLGLVAVADEAEARPRGRVNVWVGGPFWWGIPFGYGYPYVVERPVILQPPVEPLFAPSATQQSHSWYYCRDAQMYYPYVTSCPSAWQEVPATSEPVDASAAPATPSAPAAPVAPTNRALGTPVPPARSN
ncbi:MAG: hypothetical protein H7Z15_13585 [Rhizobacter sp.]|nr:hypothetical protein [Rhizobacter sp.]